MKPIAYINVEKRTLEFAEPIKWHTPTVVNLERIPLFTQRTWVGLTDEDIQQSYETTGHYQTLRPQDRFAVFALARAIEAKLKQKNHVAQETNS